MNGIVHFEIPVDSPEESKKFYSEVFGWNISQWGGQDYWMAETTEMDKETQRPKNPGAGINGGIMKREGDLTAPVLTISVDDIDEHLKKIEAAGGTTIKSKQSIGEMGWTAYFKDNQGNIMGLWQNNNAPKSE